MPKKSSRKRAIPHHIRDSHADLLTVSGVESREDELMRLRAKGVKVLVNPSWDELLNAPGFLSVYPQNT